MSIRVSLCGMLRLIRVDTLRRVDTVGFLAGRFMYQLIERDSLIYTDVFGLSPSSNICSVISPRPVKLLLKEHLLNTLMVVPSC